MKAMLHIAITVVACAAVLPQALAQGFASGSTGSYGPMNITTNTILDLPTNGVFNCTTINVSTGATLRFNRNSLNTPVYLLASGDVSISGTIDVSGSISLGNFAGGVGGPGGFDGGPGGFSAVNQNLPGGAGLGPGGGKTGDGGNGVYNGAGGGAYSTRPGIPNTLDGQIYGSPLLIPLIGGSGGGGVIGDKNRGGGGGGGAILIASSTLIRVNLTGSVISRGGGTDYYVGYNGGSGGAIRLVAPRVYGNGTLDVLGSSTPSQGLYTGHGRIRIDSIFRFEPTNAVQSNIGFVFQPFDGATVGSAMIVFPPNNPRLDILEAAGRTIPEGTNGSIFVELPFGASTNQTITVQARNFSTNVAIRVVLTPAAGDPISYDTNINNTASNPAQVVVPVGIPLNTVVAVNAWTR